MTGVPGSDIPTIELTAADVGDIVIPGDGCVFVLSPLSVDADGRVFVRLSAELKHVLELLSVTVRSVL